jgi:hypothetical protein
MSKVTDPELLAELNASSPTKVTDPALLAELNGEEPIYKQALKNLPADIKEIGRGTIEMVKHPIDTATGLATVARGAMQHALPEDVTNYLVEKGITPEARPEASAFAQPFKEDFGSVEGFKKAVAERPATTFLNVSGAASGLQGLARGAAGSRISSALRKSAEQAAKETALNAPKAAVLEAGQKAGYVIPPSEVSPGFWNKRLEGLAGKAAIGQEAAAINQGASTAAATRALGIPADKVITKSVLTELRKKHGGPYREVSELPTELPLTKGYVSSTPKVITSAAQDLEALKQARNDSQGWYEAYKRSASPDDLKKAKTLDATARSLDAKLANTAKAAGRGDLRAALHEARRNIAETYTVERALNPVTGDVNANVIGGMVKKGKQLRGDLKTIGEFQQTFPKYIREGAKVPTSGVSKSEMLAAAGLAMGGVGVGGPMGAVAGLAPFLSTPVRKMLLSKPYQKNLASALKKNPSKTLETLNDLVNKPKQNTAELANMLRQINNEEE